MIVIPCLPMIHVPLCGYYLLAYLLLVNSLSETVFRFAIIRLSHENHESACFTFFVAFVHFFVPN